MNYYNENDPKAAAWLRELIRAGVIADGDVDERSIIHVKPAELARYAQCHFFAGIGGWSYALRLAGVSDDEEIWTGSCPCQPLSCAGLRKGHADERHLWPAFFNLISIRKPARVVGEQVASADGREWFAGIRADMEGVGYACGAADLCSAGVGSPNIRQRIYWLANSTSSRLSGTGQGKVDSQRENPNPFRGQRFDEPSGNRRIGWLVLAKRERLEGLGEHEHDRNEPRWVIANSERSATEAGPVNFWTRCGLVPCTDGKTRRIEPESFPLVARLPRGMVPSGAPSVSEAKATGESRVERLRGYGNAINPHVAALFLKAAL